MTSRVEGMLAPELKSKWLEALRNGGYKQGHQELYTPSDEGDGRFCCLGVLAVVAGEDLNKIAGKCHLDDILRSDLIGTFDTGDPADPTFSSVNPDTFTTTQRTLAGLNDSGKTFAEIADWIEVNL